MSRRLIFLAHAVAPGRGGAEALVNAELLRALADHWPAGVTVISGGDVPGLADGVPVSSLPEWRVHALGECGASAQPPSLLNVLAAAGVRRIRKGGPLSIPARLVERGVFRGTGLGLKAAAWSRAAVRALLDELAQDPDAVVYSRALPFVSIQAAEVVRRQRRFLWIVNINDPLPPEVWPGQYRVDPWANHKIRLGLAAALPRIDGLTFPSEDLRDVEADAFPEMAGKPHEIVRHVAGRTAQSVDSASVAEGRMLNLAFAGTLRRDRLRHELREALALLSADLPDVAAEIQITFYLPHSMPAVADYAASLPVRTRVAVGLPNADLDAELARADVLLDLESEVDRPLLMTKLASYSAFAKPIWAVCASGGSTWKVLGESGWGYRSALGETETALEALLRIHGDWKAGRLHERAPTPKVAELFSPRRQVESLLRLVERIA